MAATKQEQYTNTNGIHPEIEQKLESFFQGDQYGRIRYDLNKQLIDFFIDKLEKADNPRQKQERAQSIFTWLLEKYTALELQNRGKETPLYERQLNIALSKILTIHKKHDPDNPKDVKLKNLMSDVRLEAFQGVTMKSIPPKMLESHDLLMLCLAYLNMYLDDKPPAYEGPPTEEPPPYSEALDAQGTFSGARTTTANPDDGAGTKTQSKPRNQRCTVS